MTEIELPNAWHARPYQRPLWKYLREGGKRAAVCWHRRAGKDDIGLNFAAVSAMTQPANYWHMLPKYAQARKAIWEAVDPHTRKRRIDQAFPMELRKKTLHNEMFIEFKNGSTWRVVGSDRFDDLVGAGPYGIVFSEWAISNPRAWGILGPMLEENGGWALFIYTARGKNHGHSILQLAKKTPGWFGQILKATDTDVYRPDQLERIRAEYIELDSQNGEALFQQEYECSFDAAILGAYWSKEMAKAEADGRICDVPWDETQEVLTAWDLGVADSTAIWFFQPQYRGVNIIDYYEASGVGLDHYNDVLKSKPYRYGVSLVPHDANVREFTSGRQRVEVMMDLGLKPKLVANHRLMDGVQAARSTLPMARFDARKCAKGINALIHYHAEYDEDAKALKPTPEHDWSSHGADAFRYLCVGWKEMRAPESEKPPPKFWESLTVDQLWAQGRRAGEGRI